MLEKQSAIIQKYLLLSSKYDDIRRFNRAEELAKATTQGSLEVTRWAVQNQQRAASLRQDTALHTVTQLH